MLQRPEMSEEGGHQKDREGAIEIVIVEMFNNVICSSFNPTIIQSNYLYVQSETDYWLAASGSAGTAQEVSSKEGEQEGVQEERECPQAAAY